MFGGSFVAQWGIGVIVDAVRVGVGLGHGRGPARRVRARARRSTSSAFAWFAARLARYGGTRPLRRACRVDAPCICTSSASAARSWAASPRSRRQAGPHGDRLRRQRLSADEHAARGAGHRADRRLRRGAARRRGEGRRRVRHRQRRLARQSADGGDPRRRPPYISGSAMAGRARAARPLGAGGGRHARQDDDDGDARVDPRARGPGRPDS